MPNSTDIILRNVENTYGSTVMRPGMRSKMLIWVLSLVMSLLITGCQQKEPAETSVSPMRESGSAVLFDNEPLSAFQSCRYRCLNHSWEAELTTANQNYTALLELLYAADLEKMGEQAIGTELVFSFPEKPEIILSVSASKQGPLMVYRHIDSLREMSYLLSENLSNQVRGEIEKIDRTYSFRDFSNVPYEESFEAAKKADSVTVTYENNTPRQLPADKQQSLLRVLGKYIEAERLNIWSDFEKDRTDNVAKYVFSSNGAEVASFTVCRYGSLLGLRCDRTEMIYKLPQEAFDELLAIQ